MARCDDRRPSAAPEELVCGLCGEVGRRVNELRLLGLVDCATYRCEGCGLYFRRPLPDEAAMARYYAGRSFRYPEDLERRMAEVQGSWVVNAVRGNGGDLRKMRYVEFGCGRGWLVAFMRGEQVASAIGYDPDGASVEWGRRVLGVELRQGVLAQPGSCEDSPAEGMWLVSLVHVLEHLHSPTTVLDELHTRFHRPYLFIEVPDAAWEGRIMEMDVSPESSTGQHFWSFTGRSLELLLSGVGYSIVACQRDGKPRFWDGRRRSLELHERISDYCRTRYGGGGVRRAALAAAGIAAMWVTARARTRIERLRGGYSRLDLPVIRVLARPVTRTATDADEGAAWSSPER